MAPSGIMDVDCTSLICQTWELFCTVDGLRNPAPNGGNVRKKKPVVNSGMNYQRYLVIAGCLCKNGRYSMESRKAKVISLPPIK